MATTDERGSLVEALLLAAPPGEVNDVFQGSLFVLLLCLDLDLYRVWRNIDIRAILGLEAETLLTDVAPRAFSAYNTASYTAVSLPNASLPVLLSPLNVLSNDRILDPRSKQTFVYDHVQQVCFLYSY